MGAKADNKRLDVLVQLSDRDRDTFLAALENPPKPNARLRQAAKLHKSHVKKAAR